jgi:pyruvate/2-oxoglutarate dehydrogenase complex dihydrolipoamide dehydrogenase (E3) component
LVGAFYLVAKALEAADRPIYALGHAVSGHTLKHLAAAMSGYFVLHMLRHRLPFDYHAQASSAA